ncbi:MAG: hypothetical protein Q8O00_14460 [Holophaga sp.]|nr:hypothetical protein [Holophaga sp.]
MFIPFTLGLICGLTLAAGLWLLRDRLLSPMGDDEGYLLAAARAANGRLLLRRDQASSGASLLLLKEFPNPRRIENRGQIKTLLDRKLLEPDPSGIPDRYVLTQAGQKRAERLPVFPLELVRQGSWFNSVSKPVKRMLKR